MIKYELNFANSGIAHSQCINKRRKDENGNIRKLALRIGDISIDNVFYWQIWMIIDWGKFGLSTIKHGEICNIVNN